MCMCVYIIHAHTHMRTLAFLAHAKIHGIQDTSLPVADSSQEMEKEEEAEVGGVVCIVDGF